MSNFQHLKAAHLFTRHLVPKLLGEALAKAVIERDVVLALIIVGLEAGWHVMARHRRTPPISVLVGRHSRSKRRKRRPVA